LTSLPPWRNLAFAFVIIGLASGYIEGMAQNGSLQIGVFELNFTALIAFASLIGSFIGIVLVTIYRGKLIPAIFSGALKGVATFFIGYFIPPSYYALYPEYHDFPSLVRSATPFVVGFLSYILFSVGSNNDNHSDE